MDAAATATATNRLKIHVAEKDDAEKEKAVLRAKHYINHRILVIYRRLHRIVIPK